MARKRARSRYPGSLPMTGRFHRLPHAWATMFRVGFAAEVEAFRRSLVERVLPTFATLNDEAEAVQQAAYDRMDQSPCERDPASEYEQGLEEAAEWLRMMWGIRQGTVNLYAAGLYHVVEQQLLNFHRNVILAPGEEERVIRERLQLQVFRLDDLDLRLQACGIKLTEIPSYPAIRQLKLIANTVKHSEGPDCDRLRAERFE